MSLLDQIAPEEPGRGQRVTPSAFQSAIYSAVSDSDSNLLIQAVAGSGKTTTIIEAMRFARGSSLFLAFNKAIAEDIRRRALSGDVKTLNALGHGLVMNNRGGELNARKVSDLVKTIMGDTTDQKELGYPISRLVGYAKNLALGVDRQATAEDFHSLTSNSIQGSDIPADKQDLAAAVAFEAFERSRLDTKTFDFDDQLWIPVSEGWEFPSYSNLFVDEAQDLSPIQHAMLARFHGSKVVAVGDRHQAIYGFRGALHGSMDVLAESFSMRELPLSVCYRCAREVVAEAQRFCPEILPREDAPEGRVSETDHDPVLFNPQWMIVCRNNAPLFRAILAKVRAQEPCQVLSSFLDSFQSFIKQFKAEYTSDLRAKLDRWLERERDAAKSKSKLALIYDKYDTLTMFCEQFTRTRDILALLQRLASSRSGPIFATIHKSKGLEHDHIYILRPDLIGGFGDLEPEARQQEDNLHYVAITRARETLTYGASRK